VNKKLPNKHLFLISSDDPWYSGVLTYLHTQSFGPHISQDDHWHIHHQSPQFLLIRDVLYWQGLDIFLCQCLTLEEPKWVLNDFHGGSCGEHLSRISTAPKVIHISYFWHILFHNYIQEIKLCMKCHIFTQKNRAPLTPFHTIITTNPFCKWGINFMTCNLPSKNAHK
jgi:hypothetical protein